MSFLWFYISLRSLMYTGRMWHVNEFLNYTQYIFFLSLQSWIQKVRSFIFLQLTHLFLAIRHIKNDCVRLNVYQQLYPFTFSFLLCYNLIDFTSQRWIIFY